MHRRHLTGEKCIQLKRASTVQVILVVFSFEIILPRKFFSEGCLLAFHSETTQHSYNRCWVVLIGFLAFKLCWAYCFFGLKVMATRLYCIWDKEESVFCPPKGCRIKLLKVGLDSDSMRKTAPLPGQKFLFSLGNECLSCLHPLV